MTTIHGADQPSPADGEGLPIPGRVDDLSQVTARYQPIVDLTSGICTGVEALARPSNQDAQSVTKGLAWMFRDHKLAPRLTRHILDTALYSLARLPAPLAPDLWINLTKFDLLDVEFVFDFQTLLDHFDMPWTRIVVEVHEDVMLADRNGQTFHSLQEMRRRGARVALDDFGSGYAGLKHMRDWPIDIIKIDQSFVRDIDQDDHARVVVEALMMITQARGIEVVAEGLETQTQVASVKTLKCRYGQGFVFDPALADFDLARRLPDYASQTFGYSPDPIYAFSET